MQWMLDKHYLRDLAHLGVHTIPTQYLEIHSHVDLKMIFAAKGEFILKPCISAAGVGLIHIHSLNEALHYQVEINTQLKHTSYMLQNFISEIKDKGEWSLIFIGGKYSHAVHKKPGENSIFVHAERGGSLSFLKQPPLAVIEFAKQAYQKILPAFENATGLTCDPHLILYLRLDVIETANGPVLIECEGVEPELFFRAKPQSEITFRQAVASIFITLQS
jgi:glutathione synthase/RimK-type ligase-like ATP-grasp enzyme